MGGIGGWEILGIAVIVIVLFGAKKLPEIAQSLGKGLREFKKATREVTEPLRDDLYSEAEPKNDVITAESIEPVGSIKKQETHSEIKAVEKKDKPPAKEQKA